MVYNLLQTLKATKSTNDKTTFIQANLDNELFFKVLHYALDPYRVFGIKKIPAHTPGDGSVHLEDVFGMLDCMAAGEITGNNASTELAAFLSRLTSEDGFVLQRIIDKDLKIGAGSKLVNNAIFAKWGKTCPEEKYIPTFDTMAAYLFESNKVKWGKEKWFSERKKDGMRCVYFVEDTIEDTICYSRGGKEIETLDVITKEIFELYKSGDVVDGEVLTPGAFESAMSVIRRMKKNAVPGDIYFHPFAVLTREEWEAQESTATYEEIRERLHKVDTPFVKRLDSIELEDEAHAMRLYEEALADGDEGTVIKKANGVYEFKRSNNWLKIKPEETLDLKVVGYYIGEPGTKNENRLGGFVVEYFGSKGRVEVRVGGGFKEKEPTEKLPHLVNERQKFWDERDEIVACGDLMEVEFMGETEHGSLRHPRFARFRSYKGEKI